MNFSSPQIFNIHNRVYSKNVWHYTVDNCTLQVKAVAKSTVTNSCCKIFHILGSRIQTNDVDEVIWTFFYYGDTKTDC